MDMSRYLFTQSHIRNALGANAVVKIEFQTELFGKLLDHLERTTPYTFLVREVRLVVEATLGGCVATLRSVALVDNGIPVAYLAVRYSMRCRDFAVRAALDTSHGSPSASKESTNFDTLRRWIKKNVKPANDVAVATTARDRVLSELSLFHRERMRAVQRAESALDEQIRAFVRARFTEFRISVGDTPEMQKYVESLHGLDVGEQVRALELAIHRGEAIVVSKHPGSGELLSPYGKVTSSEGLPPKFHSSYALLSIAPENEFIPGFGIRMEEGMALFARED